MRRSAAVLCTLALAWGTAACTGADDGSGDPDERGAAASVTAPGATEPVPRVTGRSEGQSEGRASEVVPAPAGSPDALADLLAADAGAGHLATAPAGGRSADGLVDQFPGTVVLVPEDAVVRSSSVSSDGARTHVALDAAVPRACDPTLAELRAWYSAGGFVEAARVEAAGAGQVSFGRGAETVTLAATTHADGCDVVTVAVLVPAADAGRGGAG